MTIMKKLSAYILIVGGFFSISGLAALLSGKSIFE